MSTSPTPSLQCLNGGAPAGDLLQDFAALARLPEGARARFWDVLGPTLADPIPGTVEAVLDRFCSTWSVNTEDLSRTLRGCRFIMRAASRLRLPREAFERDLAMLLPNDAEGAAILLAGYERAAAYVRQDTVEREIIQHGKLLVDVDWRIETHHESKQARGLNQPAVLLTLTYRDGARTEQLTVHALPQTLLQLREMLDRAR
jgi:hypothetical protein